MGAGFNKAVKPEELAEFKKLPADTLLDNINIPERAENRVPTDRPYLIVFGVAVLLLMPFLIYTLVNADIGRLSGYDNCGNVCGEKNAKYEQWPCTGKDFTNERYLKMSSKSSYNPYSSSKFQLSDLLLQKQCVRECGSNEMAIFGVCTTVYSKSYPNTDSSSGIEENLDDTGKDISNYLSKAAWRIVLASFLCLGIALLMLVLFRKATAVTVWSILGGVILFGSPLVIWLWYLYFQLKDGQTYARPLTGLLTINIILTVFMIVFICVCVFLFKKIQLVILLLKEAAKAQFAMPQLIFIPILTFFAELIVVILLLTTSIYIWSAGTLTELLPEYLYYRRNGVMVFTAIFNFWMAFWSSQFIVGFQYMVVSGAVAKWYFAKNKNYLESPILTSAAIAFKFHLGTLALGSMIITLIAIVKSLLSSLAKNKAVEACLDTCMDFLKYLTKNSYIISAMHGKPFIKSGKRAAKIIFQNAVNIASINFLGDFILFMANVLIIVVTMLITVGLMQSLEGAHAWAVYLIVFIVSVCISATCFSVYETTIDTIFLCFCEDSLLNDGMARPYAMTRDLMEFVENSKKVYGEKKH